MRYLLLDAFPGVVLSPFHFSQLNIQVYVSTMEFITFAFDDA